VREEQTRILVTVKAYPQPSRTYGETVCVARYRSTPVERYRAARRSRPSRAARHRSGIASASCSSASRMNIRQGQAEESMVMGPSAGFAGAVWRKSVTPSPVNLTVLVRA
jgi:hypothetical protein